jgi:tRNA nucleotidyltransferase (CCA-adding enzyme)
MQKKRDVIEQEIIEKITPTQQERAKIETLTKQLKKKVTSVCKAENVHAIVRVEGSVAKDTWLRENPDIDIFMRLPTSIPRKLLGETSLRIARIATQGLPQIERFAEHPYLETFLDGVRVNIVPCYNVPQGEWLSATDRTPMHTEYIKRHLEKPLRDEVRLLKKFLRGIGSYGAEIKTGGFSGYLCELLILHHKSFSATLKWFAHYACPLTVDIEEYYKGRERELTLVFQNPLVVVDPVDKGRNVASAVQKQRLYTLIAAARAYLQRPSVDFFYPSKTKPLTTKALQSELDNRGSSIIFLILGHIRSVPDVLWGQLYRTKRALRKQFELNDFCVIRDSAWSDEKTIDVFMLEIEQQTISGVKKHHGPPLERENESENFLLKYANNDSVVAGPYIEDGRWIVNVKRKYRDAKHLLTEILKTGGKNTGIADLISEALEKKFQILVDDEVIETYSENEEFAKFLTGFLSGKPFWL